MELKKTEKGILRFFINYFIHPSIHSLHTLIRSFIQWKSMAIKTDHQHFSKYILCSAEQGKSYRFGTKYILFFTNTFKNTSMPFLL